MSRPLSSMEIISETLKSYGEELNEGKFEFIYNEVARLASEHHVSAVPILTDILYQSGIDPLLYMDHVPTEFCYRGEIESIHIPSSIQYISNYAFYKCEGLREVSIPESVTAILTHAFMECSKLQAIELPDSIISMGDWVFARSGLTSIKLPSHLKTIPFACFRKCLRLKTITIPKSVSVIMPTAFSECEALTDVYYEGSREEWYKLEGHDRIYGTWISFHFNSK